MRARHILCFALALGLAAPALAEEDARARFDAEVARVRTAADAAGAAVRRALAARDWNAWWSGHDAYVLAMNQGVLDVETAVTQYLFGTLDAGGRIDDVVHRQIGAASDLAADFARRRVVATVWASLTRRGVRPEMRTAALELLARQGVYGGGEAGERPLQPARDAYEGQSPSHGRVPGTAEAAEYLSKWQYAQMRAESVAQTLRTYEAELATTPAESRMRKTVEQRVTETRAELDQLLLSVQEYRAKYFASGGR